jgi:membrane protein required for colicin V production
MDFITVLDGIVLVVVLVSALLAMYRGLIREVFSIASWAAAAGAAYYFHKPLLPYAKQYINNDYVALGVVVGGVFLITLIVVSYITMKMSDFVLDSAFGALDRSAGFLFGAARGVLLLVVAMLFFNWFVPSAQQPKWVSGAKSKPVLDYLGQQLVAALPENAEEQILNRLRNRGRNDTVPAEPDQDPRPAPQQRTDNRTGTYANGERKSLDQLITGSTRP